MPVLKMLLERGIANLRGIYQKKLKGSGLEVTGRKTKFIHVALLFVFMAVSVFPIQAYAGDYGSTLLKFGSRGPAVTSLQQDLTALGYNTYGIDSIFGVNTQNSVVAFQKAKGIAVDGLVGPQTKTTLNSALQAKNTSTIAGAAVSSHHPEMADWWTVVDKVFPRKANGTVTDINTGITFNVHRYGGTNHIDAEPITAADTAKMKAAYGGQWSWSRRAVIVSINGRVFAGSINGMPHGGQDIYDNNFDGQFCIHFLNSRTHATNRVDEAHQAAVHRAANYTY